MNHILVIDDEKGLRDNLKDILELNDFVVHTAKNGVEGLTKALALNPDLILCDVMMPLLDGYGFIEQIKKTDLAGIPLIFLTAKAEKSDERFGMHLGADDYITKPFTVKEVVDSVKTRLEKSQYVKNKIVSSSNKSSYELSKLFNGHEIRTPLTIIGGMTLLLEDMICENKKAEAGQIIKYVQNAVFNLGSIINNIYLFEMLKSELDENIFTTNLNINLVDNIKNLAQEFDRNVLIDIDGKLFANSRWMYFINYIYMELIVNAIKFTEKSDTIIATNRAEDKYTIIKVKNNGSTLNCDPKLLKPFNKCSNRMDISGMGLGLYNISQIATKVGGEMKINSNNAITEVEFYFPSY
jgi:two-component system sensor histidine kinase/response regulator